MATREDIVNYARSYLGTPFAHQGRLRGTGVDCVGLLAGIAQALRLTSHDISGYSRRPDGKTVLAELLRGGFTRIIAEDAKAGDVILFWVVRPDQPAHVGILTASGYIIHTYAHAGKVIEVPFSTEWRNKVVCAFTWPNVED